MKKKTGIKKASSKKNLKKMKPGLISEHFLDRDKNATYIPNDESIDDLFDSEGHEQFVHSNHKFKIQKIKSR
ncbi:MAG: hypothetical protein AABY53_08990 [Bdellovibrionota bacterium]